MFAFRRKKEKRTDEEIQKEIEETKKKLNSEKKAIEDLGLLVRMYENAKDQKGLQITEKKKVEIEKNIENLKKKLKELKEELPPRPLPQPEFVSVSTVRASTQISAEALTSPPKPLDMDSIRQKARAIYDFIPSGPDELEMKAEDIVTVITEYGYNIEDRDWWKVELNGKQGYVPATYLQSFAAAPLPPPEVRDVKQVIASYDYSANKPDELSFKYGDTINVVSQDFPGWWKGELNGKTGLFPVNYVHTVEQHNNTPAASATTATSAAAATSSADSKSADATQTSTSEVASESAPVTAESTNGDVKETEPLLAETNVSESTQSTEPEEDEFKIEYGEALFHYKANYDDELTFNKGEVFHITETETGGWYRGTLGEDDEVGLIPGNYVQPATDAVTAKKLEERFIAQKSRRRKRREAQKEGALRALPTPPTPASSPATIATHGVARDFWKNIEKGNNISPIHSPHSTATKQEISSKQTTAPPASSVANRKVENTNQPAAPVIRRDIAKPPPPSSPAPQRPPSVRIETESESSPLLGNNKKQTEQKSSCCIIL